MRMTVAFRIAFASAALGAIASVAACGSDTGAPLEEQTPQDGGPSKRDANRPPLEEEDAAVPPPDADADAGVWPTCDTKPLAAMEQTIAQIWADNPAVERRTWISSVYVTAISGGACSAGKACQIFVQEKPSYASITEAAQNAIKLFVSGAVATHFTTVAVGDRVDVLGGAWRYTLQGQNELLVQVNAKLPGCVKTISSANALTPIVTTLPDLTVEKYESTHGPLFVKVEGISGKPASPTETFGLWTTGVFEEAGSNIKSLSPFFLQGGTFAGLTSGQTTNFASITGVFGLFVPDGGPKYLEIYPRSPADIVPE